MCKECSFSCKMQPQEKFMLAVKDGIFYFGTQFALKRLKVEQVIEDLESNIVSGRMGPRDLVQDSISFVVSDAMWYLFAQDILYKNIKTQIGYGNSAIWTITKNVYISVIMQIIRYIMGRQMSLRTLLDDFIDTMIASTVQMYVDPLIASMMPSKQSEQPQATQPDVTPGQAGPGGTASPQTYLQGNLAGAPTQGLTLARPPYGGNLIQTPMPQLIRLAKVPSL